MRYVQKVEYFFFERRPEREQFGGGWVVFFKGWNGGGVIGSKSLNEI